MRKPNRLGLAAAAVVAVVLVVVAAVVLWPREDTETPDAAAADFLTAWDQGDGAALAELIDDPTALVDTTEAVRAGVDATAITHTLTGVERDGEVATATAHATIDVGGFGPWELDTTFDLRQVDGDWQVAWTPSLVVPGLTADGTVDLSRTWPVRAAILGQGGVPLSQATPGVIVGIQPERATDLAQIKAALQQTLQVDPAEVDAALSAPGVQPNHFVEIVEVSRATYDPIRPIIYPIPGIVFRETSVRAAPSPTFARHVLGRTGEITAEQLEQLGAPYQVGDIVGRDGIEAQYERQLAGTPTAEIRLLGPDDAPIETLHTFPGIAPQPVETTLDVDTQLAAEAALDGVTAKAAIVAVDTTGAVRAVVSRPLDEEFDRALSGQYPPGSTFKIVTATALLQNGYDPETPVPCNPTLVVDGKTFVNFEGGASGTEPFSTAFAESCNTAIISAASTLPDGALGATAENYGFNTAYDIGVPSTGGAFPVPATTVEKAAAAIGQGKVTASPLHMASVGAAVDGGAWNAPHLVVGTPEEVAPKPLDPGVQAQVDRLMTLVVSQGTGTALQGIAGVRGKSGTAEFGTATPPETHAWFVAYQDDLAISVLVEGGEAGGRIAAPLARTFFTTLG